MLIEGGVAIVEGPSCEGIPGYEACEEAVSPRPECQCSIN